MIIDSQTFKLSPVEQNFDINWIGNLSYANLHIDFETSFGYGLSDAYINGTKLSIKDPSQLDADVRYLLKQGGNKLTIDFAALQLLGFALGQTIITAYIDYFGASVIKLPSLTQEVKNITSDIKGNLGTAIVIIFGVAALAVSVAYISSRLPSASNLKIGDVTKSAKNIATQTHSKVKHAIMTLRSEK